MQIYYLGNNAHAMWSRQFTIFLWNKSTVKIHANTQMYVHKPTQAVQQQQKWFSAFVIYSDWGSPQEKWAGDPPVPSVLVLCCTPDGPISKVRRSTNAETVCVWGGAAGRKQTEYNKNP